MLREEQIDLRKQRAARESFRIQNLGRNRVFSDYQVANPTSGGQYKVNIRGFEVGDNSCDCPDFRTNTLGTCKHIEAVLASLQQETPAQLRTRKANITRPEIFLHYGEQLRVGLHLPARNSDQLRQLAERFFDFRGYWKAGGDFKALLDAVEEVPEEVTVFEDALEFMSRERDKLDLAQREADLLQQLEEGCLPELGLALPLYPYQWHGAIFAACRGRCILGDDMGLGKTLQTLAAVEILVRERGIERVLIISPTSVKYQWESEIRRLVDRPVQLIEGSNEQRKSQYSQPTFYRLLNYEQVLRDLDLLNAWHADLVVLDEAQRIKNWEAKTSKAVKKLRSKYAIVLTGTPLENKLEELYSLVQFVDDRRLGPAFQFLHDHRVLDEQGKLVGYRNLDKLREKLQPIFLRRSRSEVLRELPPRTDNTLYVELTEEQRQPYLEQQVTLARLLSKKHLTEVDRRRVQCCLANMRMLCDSTYLYDKRTNVSPKLKELRELLPDLLSAGEHKIVVFSQWEVMLSKLAELLDELGLGYALLHGGVPAKDRRGLLEKFRTQPDCRLFLSTDAGGAGLNLQSADTVLHIELPWNPAVLEQRTARVHRLGQVRPVQVFQLITRGSIEERILRINEQKRTLFSGLFEGTADEVSFSALSNLELLDVMRELVTDTPTPAQTATPDRDRVQACVEAGVAFLESLAELLHEPGAQHTLPPSTQAALQKGVRALSALLETATSQSKA